MSIDSELDSLLRDSKSWKQEGESIVQELIDRVDEASDDASTSNLSSCPYLQALALTDPTSELYARSLPKFRTICRRSGCLPTSYFLKDDIAVEGKYPVHQTALSDVYQGHLGDVKVALKALRFHADDRAKTRKVRVAEARCLMLLNRTSRVSGFPRRGGCVEMPPPSKHRALLGCLRNLPGLHR